MTYPLLVGETTAVEGYWSWVESTGKDHVQSVFEKGVPASILVWTLTLLVNRAWL